MTSLYDDPPFLEEAPQAVPNDSGADGIPDSTGPDGSTQDGPVPDVAETGPLPDGGVAWSVCSLYDGEYDQRAECAYVPMPFDPQHPEGDQIGVFVKRLRAAVQPARGQVWFVQGGPGGAATYDFPPWMDLTSQTHPDLDMYAADHRGTGRSERLSCPQESDGLDTPERVEGCGNNIEMVWGSRLAFFSTTESARDLGRLADLTRLPGQQLFIYGGSYGAYHVSRYLQLYPSQADGVMLDGIAPPGFTFVDFDDHMNAVSKTLFDACRDDAFCGSKLGPDPWAELGKLELALDQGHCSNLGFSSAMLKAVFGSMMYSRPLLDYLPAITYRLRRCSAADQQALATFYNALSEMWGGGDPAAFSDGLYYHVATSELWTFPSPSPQELQAKFDAAFVAGDVSLMASAAMTWPRYDPQPYDEVWPQPTMPMLMTNGALDPATPLAKAVAVEAHFVAPYQVFLPFDHAGHCVYQQTWTDPDFQIDCATMIRDQFLKKPDAPLDLSCMNDVLPPRFEGHEAYDPYLFGQPDAWENPSGYPLPDPTAYQAAKDRWVKWRRLRAPFRSGPRPSL